MNRRQWLHHLAAVPVLAAALDVRGQSDRAPVPGVWPDRPVRWILPLPAGTVFDVAARHLIPEVERLLGQPVVIDYRPGAGTRIAMAELAHAGGDSHTFAMLDPVSAMTLVAAGAKMPLNIDTDLQYLARVLEGYMWLAVRPDSPIRTANDLRRPGPQPSFALASIGSTQHVMAATLSQLVGAPFTFVPGSRSFIAEVMGGQLDMGWTTISESGAMVRAGTLRYVLTLAPTRHVTFPQVPTLREFVAPGVPTADVMNQVGFYAHAATPALAVQRMRDALNRAMMTPAYQAYVTALGYAVEPMSPPDYFANIQRAQTVIRNAVAFANIRLE